MSVETVVYGLADGETERYMETLLFHAHKRLTQEQVDKVIDYAKNRGWHSFRVSHIDLSEAPSFADTINV